MDTVDNYRRFALDLHANANHFFLGWWVVQSECVCVKIIYSSALL